MPIVSDYHRALEVATRAAQAAGDLLRVEFHLAGGPRGEPGKAPADTEAEWLIRKKLLESFPGWGYRGEETGEQAAGGRAGATPARPGAADQRHCWLVDPNDGTFAFQKGRRGSAVSIGLLRDKTPVLGVVYAFAAPDDDGDLFTWAEGCGPLRRNGEPMVRLSGAPRLEAADILILGQGTERKSTAYAALAAPARYRCAPSIAYRLALVAAGEGAAAVSLQSPVGWDYCGGHALLRGAGGELSDERGQPIIYSPDGTSKARFCFGGRPGVVAELSLRNWQPALDAAEEPAGEYALASLDPGKNIDSAGLLARAQGCLLGQLAGDSLGSLVEFQPPDALDARYPNGLRLLADGGQWGTLAGQPTDDSELALMLARSLVQAGKYDREAVARAYAFWFRSKPFDVGATVNQALYGIERRHITAGTAAAKACKEADRGSQANGSLMRISPLGIWGHAQPAEVLAAVARADADLTHPHPVCREAAAVYTIAIAHAISTGARPDEVYQHTLAWANAHSWEAPVRRALADAAERPPAEYMKKQGWVLVALQNAFYHLLHAPSLEEAVVRTVMSGGDTDTNAAIAGALMGAVDGRGGVPAQWRSMVLSCHPIEDAPGVRLPRPKPLWPVDALELAERLLLCGMAAPANGAQPQGASHVLESS